MSTSLSIRIPSSGVLRLLTASLVGSLAAAATAQADWTVGAFVGGAHTRPTSIRLIRPAESTDVILRPVHYGSESLDSPIYYGYRAAFFPRSGWLGVESELIHLKVVADTARDVEGGGTVRGIAADGSLPLSSLIGAFSITHGVNLLLVNAVARRRIGVDSGGNARWAITARLGAGASIPHAESTIGGQHLEGYEWGAASVQAAAGVELRVTNGLSIVGEYKLTHTRQDVNVYGGTVQTPLTTHHLAAGMALRVGATM